MIKLGVLSVTRHCVIMAPKSMDVDRLLPVDRIQACRCYYTSQVAQISLH